ncbi:MAG: hypothetical protein SFY68_14515 [Candidatus Sumerlaeia bacterium]|nr:hypothetical protein [Candidatus Sumerlaeia bacterium]
MLTDDLVLGAIDRKSVYMYFYDCLDFMEKKREYSSLTQLDIIQYTKASISDQYEYLDLVRKIGAETDHYTLYEETIDTNLKYSLEYQWDSHSQQLGIAFVFDANQDLVLHSQSAFSNNSWELQREYRLYYNQHIPIRMEMTSYSGNQRAFTRVIEVTELDHSNPIEKEHFTEKAILPYLLQGTDILECEGEYENVYRLLGKQKILINQPSNSDNGQTTIRRITLFDWKYLIIALLLLAIFFSTIFMLSKRNEF